MSRLLGIVHMNPEVDPSTWNHAEVSTFLNFTSTVYHHIYIIILIQLNDNFILINSIGGHLWHWSSSYPRKVLRDVWD